ncbi:hypothetical protein MMP71_15825 [Acinetobacter dispersus]|uniref:hypothetical protein n=1 Tax=Acinetobacter dispersus TaxID=70348 RepID=UPI00132EBC56|nr:hypothetical protein [Acinetobacter dispersus]MCH7385308.1 hypothetical protein [Acinetobacter dispersus]QHH98578.1 hypothetical protein FPL17_13885 [Acinetobacter dispersus]
MKIVIKRTHFSSTLIFLVATLFVLSITTNITHADTINATNKCGGLHDQQSWNLWDSYGKKRITDILNNRLVKQGDTYALYDTQILFNNLFDLAVRCNYPNRIREFANIIQITYQRLEPLPQIGGEAVIWVCRGGIHCQNGNLLGKEVQLNSAQFLGFASEVANELDRVYPNDSDAQQFVLQTSKISANRLRDWSTNTLPNISKRITAVSNDIHNGSSNMITDKDLWQIVIFSNIAGVVDRHPDYLIKIFGNQNNFDHHKDYLSALSSLMKARISKNSIMYNNKKISINDLDRGFWNSVNDNKYAGYSSPDVPVTCDPNNSQETIEVVNLENIKKQLNLGWDFSHARRLTNLFFALERNRTAIKKVYGDNIGNNLPSKADMEGFINQLKSNVWNQNKKHPLFSNYYNGTNGWYRVGYHKGGKNCDEGVPPYGLSNSYLSGGYIVWGKNDPLLLQLGETIYNLTYSNSIQDRKFMSRYYSDYLPNSPGYKINALNFLPTLVVSK